MIRKDCFARKGKQCAALNGLYCRNGECHFYKTKSIYKSDIEESNEKLRLLPMAKLQELTVKYPLLNKMLS